jgi:hypothetical protein
MNIKRFKQIIREELNLMLEETNPSALDNILRSIGQSLSGVVTGPTGKKPVDPAVLRAQTGEAGVIDVDEKNKGAIIMGDAAHRKKFSLKPGEHITYRWVGDPKSKHAGNSKFTLGKP